MAKTLKLGDTIFEIEWLNASEAFRLQPEIGPFVIEFVSALLPQVRARLKSLKPDEALNVDVGIEDILIFVEQSGPLLADILARLGGDKLLHVARKLLSMTTANGRELFSSSGTVHHFDVLMRGRTIDVWKLVAAAVRLNYPDFFTAFGGLAGRKKAASDSPASSTSALS